MSMDSVTTSAACRCYLRQRVIFALNAIDEAEDATLNAIYARVSAAAPRD
jgi:hypothetical protein